ncbi:MAG: hypothetical protein RL227_2030 [Pseudomonadota bacterium]
MSESNQQKTRAQVGKIYGVGILVFSAIFGFITVLMIFLDNLKID